MNIYTITLLKKIYLCDNVVELHFNKPTDFAFIAGQFIQVMIPQKNTTIPRSYSIASMPADDDLLFSIKIIPNGKASTHFSDMVEGDVLDMRGPIGHFLHKQKGPISCIATGVGIVPNLSLIRDELITKKSTFPIRLLFGVREETDLFWIEKLDELAKNYTNFSYEVTLSQPKNNWHGLRGRVTNNLPKNIKANEHIYICGNPHMVEDVRNTFLIKGIGSNNIHFEIF